MAKQAQDTFVAQMDDGSDQLITKGQVVSDSHELVKRDRKGAGILFRDLDLGDADESPAKSEPAKAAPAAATAKAAVKPAGAAGKST